jgi:hypothetical protein
VDKSTIKDFLFDKTMSQISSSFEDYQNVDIKKRIDYFGDKIINDYIFHEEYYEFDIVLFREIVFVFKNNSPFKIFDVYECSCVKVLPFNDCIVLSGHKSVAVYSLRSGDFSTWETP